MTKDASVLPARRITRRFSLAAFGGALAASAVAVAKSGAGSLAAPVSALHRVRPDSLSLGQQLAAQLGPDWWRAKDVIFTAVGDAHGVHYYLARESEGYFWRPLASILPAGTDASDWTGYFCVSGDSRFILANVFPALADNNPRLEDRGSLAYVINVANGRVRPLVAGVAMYYDTPGCGTGDTGVLTSFAGSGEERTDLLSVNLALARVTSVRPIAGQVTSAVPMEAGIDGYRAGSIVSVGATGPRTLASVD